MAKVIKMAAERQAKLDATTQQGQEMFEEMAAILLKAEPTSVGATAILFALSKLTACVLKAHMLTGLPSLKRFLDLVGNWSDLLDEADHYCDQQPFDEFVLTLMGKNTYNKEEPIRPFGQEW